MDLTQVHVICLLVSIADIEFAERVGFDQDSDQLDRHWNLIVPSLDVCQSLKKLQCFLEERIGILKAGRVQIRIEIVDLHKQLQPFDPRQTVLQMCEKAHARILFLYLVVFGHPSDMYLSDVLQNLGSVGKSSQKAMILTEVGSLDRSASCGRLP